MSDYSCRGQMFPSQQAAREWIEQVKIEQVACGRAYALEVYRCDDGHWHGREAR